ncbi:MAG: PEP-CTERM sorting domain-containing protein [Candidatus Auribacterota bacterium]|jgi:hypothetical protein|nr:PEP-CTERM sorting domain-containing protein [Candidatus Auribacterota bacterium]
MKKCLLVFFLLVLVVAPSYGRSIPGAPNEVKDPYFEHLPNSWYTLGTYSLFPNDTGQGFYIDPGRDADSYLFLRTIVDDAISPLWNPDFNMKEVDLSFFGHLGGDGYINFRLDWWNDPQIPEPPNDPNTLPQPDGWTPWYTISASSLPQGVLIDNSLLSPGEMPPNNWDLYVFHIILDTQPRWVSIEFELGVNPEIAGTLQNPAGSGEALITGVDFQAKCLPEPGAMLLFGFGGFWWIFKRIRP